MYKINSKHLIFFIFSVTAISARTYASIFIGVNGRDTWISALVATFLLLGFIFLIMFISLKTKTLTLEKVFYNTYPKLLGNIFLFLFCVGLFLTSLEAATVESSAIHTTIFIETPIWYCLAFFIIPAAYVASKNFRTITIVVIVTITIIFVSNLFLMALLYQYKNFQYLLPILFNGLSKENIFATLMLLGSFSSIAIIFPFLRYVHDKENLIKNSLLGTFIICILVTFVFVLLIGTFGPLRASNIYYPEFYQAQRLDIEDFLEFGDFFFLLRTVCNLFLKYVLSLTGIITLLRNKIKRKKVFITIYTVIIAVLSYFIGSSQFVMFNLLRPLQFILLVVFFVIPLITYVIYFFKYKRMKM